MCAKVKVSALEFSKDMWEIDKRKYVDDLEKENMTLKAVLEEKDITYAKLRDDLSGQIAILQKLLWTSIQERTEKEHKKHKEIAALKADIVLNSQLLARQCDLAREAETERDALRKRCESLESEGGLRNE